jgi:hypothetical protein
MAATTAATVEDLRRTATEAARAREAAAAQVESLSRTVQHWRRIADPNIRNISDGPSPSLEDVLTAKSQLMRAEQALADAQLVELRADRQWTVAEATLREALQAEFHARKRKAIAKLVPLLLAVRPAVDDLAAIEDEEQNALGPEFMRERFAPAWNTLKTGTSSFSPLVDSWLTAVWTYGLLDDEPAPKKVK